MARYFLLTAANKADFEQMEWVLKSKLFFPELTSTPPLPLTVTPGFDYRQFFKILAFNPVTFTAIVRSRQDWTAAEFETDAILTADWTARYNLSAPPVVEELPDTLEYRNGANLMTTSDTFLHYQYS